MYKRIFGVDVLVDAFKGFKSLASLKKEAGQIFEHLKDDADKAYAELWAEISPDKADSKETPANPAADQEPAPSVTPVESVTETATTA